MQTEGRDVLASLDDDQFKYVRQIVVEMILQTDLKNHFANIGQFHECVKEGLDMQNLGDRIKVLGMTLKLSDVAHASKELTLHLQWTRRCLAEFFAQGDEEKRRGLGISALCDRTTVNIPKAQLGFLHYVCKPMFTDFLQILDNDAARQDFLHDTFLCSH